MASAVCTKMAGAARPALTSVRGEPLACTSPCASRSSATPKQQRSTRTSAVLDPAITSPFKNFQGPGWASGLNAPAVKLVPKPQDTAERLRAEQAKYLMRRVAQLESALSEAVIAARMQAQVASEASCMNVALRHTNFNLNQKLREEQKLRIQLNLRITKLKEQGAKGYDVYHDPAVERAAILMVRGEEFMAMQQQLMTMQQEVVKLQAEVESQRRRADECIAQSKGGLNKA